MNALPYNASKGGLVALTIDLAVKWAPHRINVNAIAPGWFVTNIGGGHAKNPQVQREMAAVMPMHRVGFPDDIKGLALFLASPASAYITGQEITIDGGWTLGAAD
jgi:gluconate 5-dehydrogenase